MTYCCFLNRDAGSDRWCCHAKDLTRGMRTFDCCRRPTGTRHGPAAGAHGRHDRKTPPPSPPPRPYADRARYTTAPANPPTSSTFGTYIYPNTRRYSFSDAAACKCTCCSHDAVRPLDPGSRGSSPEPCHRFEFRPSAYEAAAAASTAAAGRGPRQQQQQQQGQNRPGGSSSSYSPHKSEDSYGGGGSSSVDYSRRYHSAPRSHAGSGSDPGERFTIDVVDTTTDSGLRWRYGPRYALSLSPVATASDIVSLLVEDRRRSKVMVRWDSGALEPLDEFVSIRAVRTHATQLEVKRRKSVHWT